MQNYGKYFKKKEPPVDSDKYKNEKINGKYFSENLEDNGRKKKKKIKK